jgi:nicotinamidase-related amidase
VDGARDIIPTVNSLLASPNFALKVATQDHHPKDHISFASNHPGPNNKPFESFIDMKNLVASKPEETMKQRLWPDHCVRGTLGSDFVDGLDIKQVEVFVKKGQDARVEMYSAFSDSFGNLTAGAGGVNIDLANLLKENGITDTYVVGLAGDYCVKYTAIDAAKSGFAVFVVEDAQKCVDPSSWEAVRGDFAKQGVKVVSMQSPEVLKILKG